MKSVVIVDYRSGNLHSVERAIRHVSPHQVQVSGDPSVIEAADAVVFPGQGAAKQCMAALTQAGIIPSLMKTAMDRPFLGICMGLQVLMHHSDEDGGVDGLGVMEGEVKSLDAPGLKVPHMGWNAIDQVDDHPLWHGIDQAAHFYFVHSYCVVPKAVEHVAGTTTYGASFCSAVARDQLFAIQAHPEKSGETGLQLLRNFCERV